MIYILRERNSEILKLYGIDKIWEFSEDKDIEGLMQEEKNGRIGVINSTPKFENSLARNYPIVIVDSHGDYFHPNFRFSPLPISFFERDAKDVALELLGKIIVYDGLAGKIVETEAYYGDKDPASRAYKGKKNYNRGMWLSGGHIFIYMVHANWMFNITTDGEEAQAVLIRSVEPIAGLRKMYERRGKRLKELCNGPGKWTRAFGIKKEMNEESLGGEIFIAQSPWNEFKVARAHRIGVRNDLEEPLRFFVKDSQYVSVRKIS